MKLLVITELFSPSVGGVETRFKSWAQSLLSQGHSVYVWCIDHTGQLPGHEVKDGIQIERLVAHDRYKSGGRARRHWPTVFCFCLELLERSAELRSFDGIVFGKWPLLPALLLPLPTGVPASLDWCELRSGAIWGLIYRCLIRRRRLRHIVIHAGVANWLQSRGVPSSQITVIGSAGIRPPDLVCPPRRDRSILFIGRLSEHKQPLLLLKAFVSARLGEQGFRLDIAGTGPEETEIRAVASGVPGVVVHGSVSDMRKFELLAEASLMVIPSVREGFPVVMAEACTVGTPTLTVDAPDNGTAFVIRQLGCGWVCENSQEALAEALRRYASIDSPEWQRCAEAARLRSIDTLSLEAQARQLAASASRS